MAPKPPEFHPNYPASPGGIRFPSAEETRQTYSKYPNLSNLFTGQPQSAYQVSQPDWARPLTPDEKKRLEEHRKYLDDAQQKVLKENPTLHPATADEMQKMKGFLLENFEGQLRLPDGQARKQWLAARNMEYNRTHFALLTPERQIAAQLLGKEMRGPSIFEGMASNFYDSKNGGVQWGGIAGAVGGGLIAWALSGLGLGGESTIGQWLGGWMAPILMAGGALLGSWGGRVATDYISEAMKPKPSPAKTPEPEKTASIEREREREPGRSREELAAAMERSGGQGTRGSTEFDPSNPTSGLSNKAVGAGKPDTLGIV